VWLERADDAERLRRLLGVVAGCVWRADRRTFEWTDSMSDG